MIMESEKRSGSQGSFSKQDKHRLRYWIPPILFTIAAIALLASVFYPYWKLKLFAPQYPQGLYVQAYLSHIAGDVAEIDGLNHYIGMRPLGEAAKLERSIGLIAIGAFALLTIIAIFLRNKWALILSLPTIFFPSIFLADLYFWLRNFGLNLDPKAPLSSSVKPFIPTILGEGHVGQFKTLAYVQSGYYLAFSASILICIALFFQRRAYKPLTKNINAKEG